MALPLYHLPKCCVHCAGCSAAECLKAKIYQMLVSRERIYWVDKVVNFSFSYLVEPPMMKHPVFYQSQELKATVKTDEETF